MTTIRAEGPPTGRRDELWRVCVDGLRVPSVTYVYDDTNELSVLRSEEAYCCPRCKCRRALAHGRWNDALELLCGTCGSRSPWEDDEGGVACMRDVITAAAAGEAPAFSGRGADVVARASAALAAGSWVPTRGADHVTAGSVVRAAEAAGGELTAGALHRAIGFADPFRHHHTRTWVDAVAYTYSALLRPAPGERAEAGPALFGLARAVAALDPVRLPSAPSPSEQLPFC
ncbi:hypothetical protein AB0O91_36820 [Kitasatospora sp. NPDC089797]|uniref:hypothetical protein n=1 Tax=Kitasatospora sp. NPDC089797 TaxID=3155298 RepID=UPI0034285BDA